MFMTRVFYYAPPPNKQTAVAADWNIRDHLFPTTAFSHPDTLKTTPDVTFYKVNRLADNSVTEHTKNRKIYTNL